jgi:hypothetical protein
MLACIASTYGTVTLQALGPDGSTYLTAATAFSVNGTETGRPCSRPIPFRCGVASMGERLRHLQAKADEISDETPRTRRCPTCSTVYIGTRPHCSSACARNEPRAQRSVTRTSLNKGGSA